MSVTRLAMYDPVVVLESAPTTTPPLNATAMMDVYAAVKRVSTGSFEGGREVEEGGGARTHSQVDFTALEVGDLGGHGGGVDGGTHGDLWGSRVSAPFVLGLCLAISLTSCATLGCLSSLPLSPGGLLADC